MNEEVARKSHAEQLFAQRDTHLGGLPGHVLLDLARNESAPREWRKAAVELLLDKGFAQANHPELTAVVMEIRAERKAKEEVVAVVETAIETELPQQQGSHYDFGGDKPTEKTSVCGVTTKNLMQDEIFSTSSDPSQWLAEPEVMAVEPELPPAEK